MIGTRMELAECSHKETPIGITGDLTYTVCDLCGQTRKYKAGDEYSVVITKLGYIGGKLVMPSVATPLENLTPEEHRFVKDGWDIINNRDGANRSRSARIIRHPRMAPPPLLIHRPR